LGHISFPRSPFSRSHLPQSDWKTRELLKQSVESSKPPPLSQNEHSSRQIKAKATQKHLSPPTAEVLFSLSPISGSQGQTGPPPAHHSLHTRRPVPSNRLGARGALPYAKGRTLHTIRRALTQPSRSGTHSKENAIQSSIVTVIKQQARSANTRRTVRYIHEEGKGCQRQQRECSRRRQQIAILGK
jgi:hypothetical protein